MNTFRHQVGQWLAEESGDGKRIFVNGPSTLSIEIDHDDVNHDEVEAETRKLLLLLDEYWK